MCGIAGYLNYKVDDTANVLTTIATDMGNSLTHRGPDFGSIWVDEACGIALAHRRLSIIDTTPNGHQPMVSSCGRFILIYNGEIYNADKLRQTLIKKGYSFKGYSDTEVIVNGFSLWGVKKTINKLNGMFAMGIWDRQKRSLSLVRDHFGVKPLYWSQIGQKLIFGSELKALLSCDFWTPQIDWRSLGAFLRYTYVPAPFSIYSGIKKLEPGSILTVDANKKIDIYQYWSADKSVQKALNNTTSKPLPELVEELDMLLSEVVADQLVSDVPVGAFLSGGIDSSTVVAMMQKASTQPVNTYSIGFNVSQMNEAEYAKGVAAHLGTNHTELYVTPEDVLNVVPKLSNIYDEPFADSSQLPTYLISALTRNDVRVALSGDGADEIFAGYKRYVWGQRINGIRHYFPPSLRGLIVKIITNVKPTTWDALFYFLPKKYRPDMMGDKIHKAAPLLGARDQLALYRTLVTHWEDQKLTPNEVYNAGWARGSRVEEINLVQSMQLLDTLSYLPDCILTKVDRASMANSLEVRPALLDQRVFEFCWSIPFKTKFPQGIDKTLLKQVLHKYVPLELTERPKAGFSVPIGEWLKGPLKEWASDLLATDTLGKDLGLDTNWINYHWQQHLEGSRNWGHQLWVVLTLASWYNDLHK